MYSEWASLSNMVVRGGEESNSVLGKFPPGAGKEVALSIVRQLASNIGITQAAEPSTLTSDREVQWCMEVSNYNFGHYLLLNMIPYVYGVNIVGIWQSSSYC